MRSYSVKDNGFVGILLLVALRIHLHRPLGPKRSDTLICLTAKHAHQFCAELRATEYVDGKVEGGVEEAD